MAFIPKQMYVLCFGVWSRCTQELVPMELLRGISESIFSSGTQQDKRGESNVLDLDFMFQLYFTFKTYSCKAPEAFGDK